MSSEPTGRSGSPKHPQIVLYQPEIPQNTGNIARLAAATQSRLNLIEPLGFEISEKKVRRAGLDYWPYVDLHVHSSFADFRKAAPGPLAFLSKKASKSYTEIPTSTTGIVFGRETSGLPDEIWEEHSEQFYNIPMYSEHVRSLNLANAVAIVVYDLLRRLEMGPLA